ncbi:hypothetical protein HZA86_05690 [Candidatus Uhrbacteria bacterium]|nr:hypothetical protein [Candidatus Uhrbacteria bacterium]
MPIPRQHPSRASKIALLCLLTAGALFVLFWSFRSVYQTFSAPIRPLAASPAIVGQPQSAPVDTSALAQDLLGSQTASAIDAGALRTMLGLQGVDQKALASMTDEQLLKSYKEFMDRVSKAPQTNK